MKWLLPLIATLVTALHAHGQDLCFFSTNQSLIYINPSFAGSNNGVRSQTSFSDVVPSLAGRSYVFTSSLDFHIKPLGSGLAVSYEAEVTLNGNRVIRTVNICYAQRIQLNEDVIVIPSLQAGYGHRKQEERQVFTLPALGSFYSSRFTHRNFGNVGAGAMLVYRNKVFAGASLDQLFQRQAGWSETDREAVPVNLHAAYNFNLSETSLLQATCHTFMRGKYSVHRLAANTLIKNHFLAGAGVGLNNADAANLAAFFINAGYRSEYFGFLAGYGFNQVRTVNGQTGNLEAHLFFSIRPKDSRGTLAAFEQL